MSFFIFKDNKKKVLKLKLQIYSNFKVTPIVEKSFSCHVKKVLIIYSCKQNYRQIKIALPCLA